MWKKLIFAVLLVTVFFGNCWSMARKPKGKISVIDPNTGEVVRTMRLTDIFEGERLLIEQASKKRPAWDPNPEKYENKRQDYLYFRGVSVPNEYKAKALEDAEANASRQIATFLMNTVDFSLIVSESLRNSDGWVPVQTLVRDTLGSQVRRAIIRGQRNLENYEQKFLTKELGAVRYYWEVSSLYELPRVSLAEAVSATQEEIQKQAQKERDQIKRELMKENTRVLEEIKKKLLSE